MYATAKSVRPSCALRNCPKKKHYSPNFNLNTQEKFWYMRPNDQQLVLVSRESRCNTKSSHIVLHPSTDARLYYTISEVIGNLIGEFEDYHHAIVEDHHYAIVEDRISQLVGNTAKEFNEGHQILEVSVDVTLAIDHVCDGRILIASEELSDRMVAASKSSIELLELMGVDERNSNDKCMVCLDEIGEETEVLCLPCSHMFHAECITKWLEKSHYCPLCRFELPTD
ncbi:hypothetical protein RND71_008612 [Anisodus tanguticus]|uniref:RING-type E3 ubiquitin transferase n=1 Tax=Anisodus tanguticus TaxID=243964 RepID=A0AAE1SL52_9SOLA|nr:hypothetical protein RND71_008612 [Anisodus tanguticus]